jgi:hypothetical protein
VQSGLILDPSEAYQNLVGALPTNPNARADGLLRVMPFKPDSSLLFHKLQWVVQHHGRDYGNPMPFGGQSLSVGQIEFIRRWIEEGAPRTGDGIDPRLLDDRTRPDSVVFTPLERPARGFQFTTGVFTIEPHFEREIFIYRRVGNDAEIFVNRIETKMRVNSHHLLLYTFTPSIPPSVIPPLDVVRDIRRLDGTLDFFAMRPMAYHVFFAGAMTSLMSYTFPAGVALRLPANATIDLNSHYVNRGHEMIVGEAYANLHTVDPAQVQHVARTLNLPNFDITLPPKQRTTIAKTFTFDRQTTIVALTSHMHQLGERFEIYLVAGPRDGELIYSNTDWSHPAIITYASPIVLAAGEGLRSVITYNNTTDRTIGFGLTSEDEMGIVFGYAY